MVGTDEGAAELVRTVQERPELGYRAVDSWHPATPKLISTVFRWSGTLREDVAAECGTGVLVSLDSVDGPTVNRLSRRLTDVGLHVTLVSNLYDIDISRLRVQEIDNRALLYIEPTIRTGGVSSPSGSSTTSSPGSACC